MGSCGRGVRLGLVLLFSIAGCGSKLGSNPCPTSAADIHKLCVQQGDECGLDVAVCNHAIDCGGCPAGLACVGNLCEKGCFPPTGIQIDGYCLDHAVECGPTSFPCQDGSGTRQLDCGSCSMGATCMAGKCVGATCKSFEVAISQKKADATFLNSPYTCTTAPVQRNGRRPSPLAAGPCTLTTYSGNLLGNPTYLSAGTITITGGTQTVTMTADATTKMYSGSFFGTALYSGGETMMVSAAGGDVAAFSGSLTAPTQVTLTAPAWPAAGQPIVINRASDLAVSWTGAGAGNVGFTIVQSNSTSTLTNSLFCSFTASAGSGTIPTASLQKLSAGTAQFSAVVNAGSIVSAGADMVRLDATDYVLLPGGLTSGAIQATLQ